MNTWIRFSLNTLILVSALGAGILANRACTASTGSPATKVFLTTPLPDSNGRTVTLDTWKGKIRVVNFWASWCPPCLEEIPIFIKAQQNWGPNGVQFVGIAIDTADAVKPFAARMKINYPLLLAEEQGPPLMAELGNSAGVLPFTLIIDGKGRVLQHHAGEVSAAQLESWLKAAVAAR